MMMMADNMQESVADHCRRPLLRLDAGLMCNDIDKAEEAVSAALKLAERWKAVALIDEADLFLQQRSPSDLTRNTLVSGASKPLSSRTLVGRSRK